MHSIPLSCTSSPCKLLFLKPGVYGLVQATVGVGTVLIWDFCVAYTRGGELGVEAGKENFYKAPNAPKLIYTVILWCSFVVQSPPPPEGEPSLREPPPPKWGGTVTTLGGRLQGGGVR